MKRLVVLLLAMACPLALPSDAFAFRTVARTVVRTGPRLGFGFFPRTFSNVNVNVGAGFGVGLRTGGFGFGGFGAVPVPVLVPVASPGFNSFAPSVSVPTSSVILNNGQIATFDQFGNLLSIR